MGFAENGPPMLRQLSVQAVIDVLLDEGPTSRADLAKRTGISKQTMSDVIRTLEESGWVRPKGIVSGRVGRTAVTYELSPDIGYTIGAEIGASTVRMALADVTGAILAEREEASVGRDVRAITAQVERLFTELAHEAGIDRDKVLFATMATPGVVDPAGGGLRFAPNFADTGQLDVRAGFQRAFGCDVVIENDVKSALIGEAWLGAATGMENVVFVQLGTGIGLGVLQDGKLQRGATGAAGEIAYLPIGADPETPESLERGALECAIGAKGISARYETLGGQPAISVKDIFSRARSGEQSAIRTVRETAEIAALLVIAIGAMHDPRKIIFGGGIGRDPLMVAETLEALKLRSLRDVTIETAQLGQRSAMLGAVAIAINALHRNLFSPAALPEQRLLPPTPVRRPHRSEPPATRP